MSSGNGFGAASSWLIQKGLAAWSRLTSEIQRSAPATTDTGEESSSTYKEFSVSREQRNVQPSTSRASYPSRPNWPRGPPEPTHQARYYHGRTFIRLNKTPDASSQGSLDRYRPKQSSDFRGSAPHIRGESPDRKPSALLRQAASGEHVFPSTSTYTASSLDARGSVRDLRYPSSSQGSLAGSASSVSVLSGSPRYHAPKRCLSPLLPSTRSDLQELSASSIGTIQPDLYKKEGPLFLSSKSSGAIFGRLHLRLKYDFDRSDFHVHLIEVHDLPGIERGGFIQPYVRLQLIPPIDNRKRQTAAYLGSGNLCLEEIFKFPVAFDDLQCRTLLLQILDNDRSSRSDVMGEVKIFIPDIELSSSDLEIWAEITRTKKPQHELQAILVSISYLPSAERLTVVIIRADKLILP